MRRGSSLALLMASAAAVLLAASTLSRVYTNLGYLPELVAVLGIAFGAGWLARRFDVPAALTPAVSFVALVEFFTLVYFRQHAYLGLFPTTTVFRDAATAVNTASRDIKTLAAPVLPTDELIFVTLAGVFAVAVLVDLLVFSSRRPVTAGLPLLALFIIPASLSPTGAGWLNFTLAATGYLALLTAEGRERVRRWGRRLAPDRLAADEATDALPLFRVARGIGAAAIGLAIVVPGIVPGVGDGLLNGSGDGFGFGSGSGPGGKRSLLINPIVNIKPSLHGDDVYEILRVRTDGRPEYLSLAVLNQFTGDAWEQGYTPTADKKDAKKGELPLPPGLADETARERYTARIETTDRYQELWLPTPYSLARLRGISGRYYYNEQTRIVFSTNTKARDVDYEVEAIVARPDPNTVSDQTSYPADVQKLRELPVGSVDEKVREIAQGLTINHDTPWAKVVALQEFFTSGEFTYDLNVPPGTGSDSIRNFLEQKVGYCEQFAGTMAVMVRAIGLPSRVVVGFTPGTFRDGYWSVTNKDLHAWPEVYFPGAGWTRFEPTPPVGGITRPAHAIAPVGNLRPRPTESAAPGPTSTALPRGNTEPTPLRDPLARLDPATPGGLDDRAAANRRTLLLGLLGLVGVVVTPTLPAATRVFLRRRRRRGAGTDADRAHVAWNHLEDDANDLGYRWPASASPRAAARELVAAARLTGAAADAVRRLARAEEIARYAPAAGRPDGLDRAVATVRAALLEGVSRWVRLRAMLLPASTLRQVAAAVSDSYVVLVRRWDRAGRSLRRRVSVRGASV